jgi:dephospho-CoA kinase
MAMQIIGLLGGVASGKSFVAEQFRRLGAGVLDADRVGHEVLLLPEARSAIRKHFGGEVFRADGQVDRKALGRIVFGPPPDGPRELAILEQITHPEIRLRLKNEAERMAADGVPAAILDAPVMLKSGWDEICSAVVFVEVPDDLRRERALARGWTNEEFEAREAAQESLEVKRRRADFVIDNSATAGYTQEQIERLWHSLVG